MTLEFEEYYPKKILNVHNHVDGPWFWGKYTAHPYVGCRSGCEFCYLRGSRYLGRRSPETFNTRIQIKMNAVELLRGELFGREREIISVGDWQQPAEDRYQLSRGMLMVILEYGFPLFIVERSPLLTRDIDLLLAINEKSWVGVVYSLSNLDPGLKHAFEPQSPGIGRRLKAMAQLSGAGLQVGAALMPVLPFVGDDEKKLDAVIRAIKDHGGKFVIGGGLTMDAAQAKRTLMAFRNYDPAMVPHLRQFYRWEDDGEPNYGPPAEYNAQLGLRIRALCERHGILDRMPRYILPGPLSVNKRIAERLFLRTYDLELERANNRKIWAYRKAAWAVDESGESILDIMKEEGELGLSNLSGISVEIAGQIVDWLKEEEDIVA